MAQTFVVNYVDAREILFPVSGAGSNIPVGTLLMKGATGGTNKGVLIPVTASSNASGVGILNEPHIYGASGDALTAGSTLTQWFPISAFTGGGTLFNAASVTGSNGTYPSHRVELYDSSVVCKVDYDLTTAIAWASGSGTSQVVTSFEDNYDGGFLYTNAGIAIGQLNFVQASSSGTITMVAPTVQFTTTSRFTKIQPLFLDTLVWTVNTTTNPTIIGGTAAAGTGRAVNLANFININGLSNRLDPKIYNNTVSLNTVSQLGFYSYLNLVDTVFHRIN